MQINSLLPVLLQLLMTGEQNQTNKYKAVLQPPAKQQIAQVHNNSANSVHTSQKNQPANRVNNALEGINQTSPSRSIANKENPNTQSELIFLPLPLKSEIFPDAKFYKQVTGRAKNQEDTSENQHRLVFGLKTPALGELYFLVIQNKNNLSIKCAASRHQTTRILKKSFTDLKDKLEQLGWKKIHCSCIHVKNPGELPGLTPAGFIDLKI